MKLKESLAAEYWIDNTKRIYEENLHVSSPVMEAYEAGFEKARELCSKYITLQSVSPHWSDLLLKIGEEEV